MFAGMNLLDLIGMLVSFVLTFMVLMYIFEDNQLFRLAIYIFIGAAAGYAGAVAIKDVLLPRLFGLEYSQMLLVILWIVLLLMKISPKTAKIGNPAAGLLVGVGAAIAVGGAIQGTLWPQITSSGNIFSPTLMRTTGIGGAFGYMIQGVIVLIGTIASLAYFHFGAKPAPNQIPSRNKLIEMISKVGEGFIAITFGVIFAGIYSAALTALIERLYFLIETISKIFGL